MAFYKHACFCLQVMKSAGMVLLQREIPEEVNTQVAQVWHNPQQEPCRQACPHLWKAWPKCMQLQCTCMALHAGKHQSC